MAALTVDFRKHSGPTPVDDMAARIITDNGSFTLDFKQHEFCASPHMLLTMFLFQKWHGSHFPEDVWVWWLLMHWLRLQSTPCEALPSVWISFAWQYSQACGHPCCLCTCSYLISSFQSTLHLICFDTALCDQPPLSVMTLCDLLSFGGYQWLSSGPLPSQQCSPLLWFQRTRDTQNLYCMDGHLLQLKCKYSNILRYWFLTFISCKLQSSKNKKQFEVFYFACKTLQNLTYMNVSLFEISYEKNWTFSAYSFFFRCICINGSLLLYDREIKKEKLFLLGLSKQRFKPLCVVFDKVRAQAHQKHVWVCVSSPSLCLFSVLVSDSLLSRLFCVNNLKLSIKQRC